MDMRTRHLEDAMKNLAIAAVIPGLLGSGGSKWLLHSRSEVVVDDIATAISPFATIEYRRVNSTVGGKLIAEFF